MPGARALAWFESGHLAQSDDAAEAADARRPWPAARHPASTGVPWLERCSGLGTALAPVFVAVFVGLGF